MALADPQSVTISGTTSSLARTGSSVNSGTFGSGDGRIVETVSHQNSGKKTRHLIRLDHSKVAADPFQSSLNAVYSMATYMVIEVPAVGYTVAEAKAVVDGFIAQLSASTGAMVTKVLGNEN